ncbi:hypothetical protein [Clostridium sp.]|uniref:hypothetical protein n=1 Tax=Clostridium sp. TaxID=1506 RepID=UPI002FCAD3DC
MNTVKNLCVKLAISENIAKDLLKTCEKLDVNLKEVHFKKARNGKNRYKIFILNSNTKSSRKRIYTYKFKIIKFSLK